jgi:hypothetical protein
LVHVDSTTKTLVNLNFTAFGGTLIYSVRGYIILWDDRLNADFGTVGGEIDVCMSEISDFNFSTS